MAAFALGLGLFRLAAMFAAAAPQQPLAPKANTSAPITQRTASMMFDLPHPLGPTTAVRFSGNEAGVGSTKDLNPANLIVFSLIVLAWRPRPLLHPKHRRPGKAPADGSNALV